MTFHYPSFVFHLERKFDLSFDVYAHNWIAHVITGNMYFTLSLVQGMVIEALLESLMCAPDGSPYYSLTNPPLETHLEALRRALLGSQAYLDKGTVFTGAGERIDYRIDLRLLQHLVIQIRKEQDVALAAKLLPGEIFMSDRLLCKKIHHTIGVNFPLKRCQDIMHMLADLGYVENNGNIRYCGREVLV